MTSARALGDGPQRFQNRAALAWARAALPGCSSGLIYFFPAVHKLEAMGLDWALSDNLRHQLWWKWAQDPRLLPRFHIDRVPWLLHGLAALTLLFWSRLRVWFSCAARACWPSLQHSLFHAGTHVLMGIDF